MPKETEKVIRCLINDNVFVSPSKELYKFDGTSFKLVDGRIVFNYTKNRDMLFEMNRINRDLTLIDGTIITDLDKLLKLKELDIKQYNKIKKE